MYIYENKEWPHFYWDQKNINSFLIELRHSQGKLIGALVSIGFDLRNEVVLKTITQDVVKTSEIEGEILDYTVVRSSVARHLGLEIAALDRVDRNVEGVVEMLLDATQNYDQQLDKERILNWHRFLFPNGTSHFSKIQVGNWRKGPVQVVSGRLGKETVHFEAPRSEKIDEEMALFLDWLNHESKTDLVLKAAIGHLWFVTIHPFDDGNGRIGRAIVDFLLARSENSSQRFYSLSSQIQRERKEYYTFLEKTQKGTLDITAWIMWFFGCMKRAIEDAFTALQKTLQKRNFWENLSAVSLNERQKKVINLLLEDFVGNMTSSKWAKITKCSQDTAYRDISDLLEKKILAKSVEGGRSTSYHLFIC